MHVPNNLSRDYDHVIGCQSNPRLPPLCVVCAKKCMCQLIDHVNQQIYNNVRNCRTQTAGGGPTVLSCCDIAFTQRLAPP